MQFKNTIKVKVVFSMELCSLTCNIKYVDTLVLKNAKIYRGHEEYLQFCNFTGIFLKTEKQALPTNGQRVESHVETTSVRI